MQKKITIILFSLFFALNGFAQNRIAKAETDSANVQIGDHIKFKISLQTNEKDLVIFPVLSDTMDKRIEFISVSALDTIVNKKTQTKTLSKTFTLTIFEPGEYTFPEIPIFIKTPTDNEYFELLTNPVTITVGAPEVNLEKDIKGIKTVWKIPITFKEILPYLLILLGLGLLVFVGIYVYRKWKNKEPLFVFAPKPVIPAHVEALENLEKLRLKQLWQYILVKEYYTDLIDILSIYIERSLHIYAVEMTSDELIDAIENSELENKSELLEQLRNTLPTADLVKFAKASPLADEHDRCFKDVKQFVEITMPKENNVTPVEAIHTSPIEIAKHVSPNEKQEEDKS
ncbi:MAG: hypothetical protein LBP96_06340 [Bacteroidales bacterium]|jgi:hypothetical protein|nr:hypothetical protein [Bacteroidales bacterium]